MDLGHLRAFVAVAQEGTFTGASRRLHISQPPLSRYVQQLERELGTVLFVRSRKGVALTLAGRSLLKRALAVLKAFREIEEFASPSHARSRALHIGIGCGLREALEHIRALHAARVPGSRITAQERCSTRHWTDDPAADLVITRDPPDAALFDCEVLFEEQFVVLISDRHRLARRESVALADLVSEPLLLFERQVEPGSYDATLNLIQSARIRPRIVQGQPPPCTLGAMLMIASGDGYYLDTTSPFTQPHRAGGVAAIPLRDPHVPLEVRLAWRADAPHDVNEFVRSARAAFRR